MTPSELRDYDAYEMSHGGYQPGTLHPDAAERVQDLLSKARFKRRAAREAHDACDHYAESELINQAIVLEGAANDIDPSHASPSWAIEQ